MVSDDESFFHTDLEHEFDLLVFCVFILEAGTVQLRESLDLHLKVGLSSAPVGLPQSVAKITIIAIRMVNWTSAKQLRFWGQLRDQMQRNFSEPVFFCIWTMCHQFLARDKDTGCFCASGQCFPAPRLFPLVSTFQGEKMLAGWDISSLLMARWQRFLECHCHHKRHHHGDIQRRVQEMRDFPLPDIKVVCPFGVTFSTVAPTLVILQEHFGRLCQCSFWCCAKCWRGYLISIFMLLESVLLRWRGRLFLLVWGFVDRFWSSSICLVLLFFATNSVIWVSTMLALWHAQICTNATHSFDFALCFRTCASSMTHSALLLTLENGPSVWSRYVRGVLLVSLVGYYWCGRHLKQRLRRISRLTPSFSGHFGDNVEVQIPRGVVPFCRNSSDIVCFREIHGKDAFFVFTQWYMVASIQAWFTTHCSICSWLSQRVAQRACLTPRCISCAPQMLFLLKSISRAKSWPVLSPVCFGPPDGACVGTWRQCKKGNMLVTNHCGHSLRKVGLCQGHGK